MKETTFILLAAGNSTRFGIGAKKQWLYQEDKPLWQKVADDYANAFDFENTIITGHKDEISYMELFGDYTIIGGGDSRQASIRNALKTVDTPYVLINDVARACLDTEMISRILEKKGEADCIVPALDVSDTVYIDDKAVDRDRVRLIQTPQLSKTEMLRKALDTDQEYTDESSAIRAIGGKVLFVKGSAKAHKLTRMNDIEKLPCLAAPSPKVFTGYGIDIHPFEEGKEMKLCGVTIDSPFGFKAHSDGDVAIHAIIDALMGAAGMGDIGELFPDTDAKYAGADSAVLLQNVAKMIRDIGYEIYNVDITILAQVPKILPYKKAMRGRLSELLGLTQSKINIKATTAEKLGFVGRKEGVTVHAVATLGYFEWTRSAK